MPRITVPKEHAAGLSRITTLSTNDVTQVVAALQRAKSLNVKELSGLICSALPALAPEQSREVVGTLLSLYSVRTGKDLKIGSFIKDLLAAATLTAESQPVEVLEGNLTNLLSVRPLSMIAKARSVHVDHENTFCSVRILSDLRPVFDADVKEEPVGFVLTHMLNIGYHHAGKHTRLHIAMDKTDIDNLIAALQRSQEKAATLSRVSGKIGYSILAE